MHDILSDFHSEKHSKTQFTVQAHQKISVEQRTPKTSCNDLVRLACNSLPATAAHCNHYCVVRFSSCVVVVNVCRQLALAAATVTSAHVKKIAGCMPMSQRLAS